MNSVRRLKGFTLVELMVVVAIIGLIAAIAYPNYIENVKDAKRAEAMAALTNAAQALEKRRAGNYSYEVPDLSAVFATQVPVDGAAADAYYNLSVVTTATTYTLTATPVAGMAGDGELTLTNTGAKTWGAKACWPDSSNC